MSIRILIAEDRRMMPERLRSILTRDELHLILTSGGGVEIVGEADGGLEAIEMARALAPDVVIMDIGIRGQSGVEATRKIKAENREVQVIAVSTYFDSRYVLSWLEAGASGYVLKATAYDDLRRAVDAVTKQKIFLSAGIASAVVEGWLHPLPGATAGDAVDKEA